MNDFLAVNFHLQFGSQACPDLYLSPPTSSLTYNDANELLTEAYSGAGSVLAGLSVTNGYDQFARRTNVVVLNSSSSVLVRATNSYDAVSRLAVIGDGGANFATYTYVANSPLVSQIVFKQNATTSMTTTKSYDFLNRLLSISSTNSPLPSPLSYAYLYNDANQRVRCTHSDGSFWLYEYDSLGQVKSGKKYWPDWTPVAGQQFEYGFDDIGNRASTKAGGDSSGQGLRSANYTANNLNQYTSRDVPGAFDVLGAALASDTVTVNSASVYRHGEYYRKELTVANTSAAVWQSVAVAATGETTVNGNVFVPKTQEQFTYDLDGNLLTDGRWTYTWDAENRLMGMVALSTVPTSAKLKLDFTYDWKSRRIQKTVSTWNGSSYGSPVSTRFLYDGWNLIAALNSSSSVLQSFLWGSDLSGSPQRAGGVGGLLVANDSVNGVHFATFDGNGNVVALVKGSDGTLSARYEYGVFGEALRTTGLMAKPNPFRWSTRFQDDETDFVMYPRRPYTTSAGRWLGRDAKGEGVAPNLYAFLANCPLDSSDPLGLAPLWYTLQVDPTESDDPSHVGFYPNAILLPVIYPKNGGKCACRGQLLGVAAGAAWIDLSTSLGLKDVQPAYYNNVVSPWPYWNPAYKRIFENPRYVGAGFTAVLRQPAIGVACCKNPVWYNYIVHSWWPDTSDGRFPGNQFVDSPGGLRPPARSFSSSYKLVLKCEDPGWPAEEVGRWYWGVDIQLGTWQWTGTFYPPTSDVVTSWPF